MPLEFKFKPLQYFEWWKGIEDNNGNVVDSQLIGAYHPGMTYNCTRHPKHDALREMCKQWESEGKITILVLRPAESFKIVKV